MMVCCNNVQHPEHDVLMRVYSTGKAPWDSDDYMLPVIADDPLLQFGQFFIFIHPQSTSTETMA